MSKSTPSLLALLGLVAVAGYQNREKLSSLLATAKGPQGQPESGPDQGQSGFLAEMAATFNHGASEGGGIAGGVSELVDRFRNAGKSTAAESWVSVDRQNESVGPDDLEQAIGLETIDELSRKTGLSRSDIVARLAAALPETVNRLTPQGRLPSEDEARDLF